VILQDLPHFELAVLLRRLFFGCRAFDHFDHLVALFLRLVEILGPTFQLLPSVTKTRPLNSFVHERIRLGIFQVILHLGYFGGEAPLLDKRLEAFL
jgi:hypothetical protein